MPTNPYTPGAGKRPRALVGRGRQLVLIDHLIDQFEGGYSSEAMAWSGLRGMGKTVLLREGLRRLQDRGWLVGYYEIRQGVDIGVTVAEVLNRGQQLLPPGKPMSRAMSWLRSAAAMPKVTASHGDLAVELGIRPRDGAGRIPVDALDNLFLRLGAAAASAGVGAVFLLDELQLLRRADLSALLHASEAAQDLPVTFIGAGLPNLPFLLAEAGSYSERLAFDRVDRLSNRDAKDALELPAAEHGVMFAPEVLKAILGRADGYPYFLQLYGQECWRAAGSPSDRPGTVIERAHFFEATAEVQRQLDVGIYAIRVEKASPLERRYLATMASLGDSEIPSGAVARMMGRSVGALSPQRERLIEKGLVYSRAHGLLEFSVPGFSDYLRRNADLLSSLGEESPPG